MSDSNTANPDMVELWNGPGARSWITAQALLDEAFRGFETLLADIAAEAGARRGGAPPPSSRHATLALHVPAVAGG